ncbi:hypothetical protein S245_067234 [Arachis hypogaea]
MMGCILSEKNMVWRAPSRSLDDRARSRKDEEDLNRAIALSLGENFKRPNGDVPCENSLLRQVSSLLRRLPVIESGKFQDDFLMIHFVLFLQDIYEAWVNKANDLMKN